MRRGAPGVSSARRKPPPRRRIQPLLRGNQFGVFGEKIPTEENILGNPSRQEDENRFEIAQLMPTDPMVYNDLMNILSCGNARISFQITEKRIFFALA